MFVFAAVFSGTSRVAVAAEKAGDALVVIALMVPLTRIRFDPMNGVKFPV